MAEEKKVPQYAPTPTPTLTAETMKEYIEGLELPSADKKRLLSLTPAKYVGQASKLAGLV